LLRSCSPNLSRASRPIASSSFCSSNLALVFLYRRPLSTYVSFYPLCFLFHLMIQQLFTHAELMFNNECLGELHFEATTGAIFIAGAFISFLVDYLGHRYAHRLANNQAMSSSDSENAKQTVTTGHLHSYHAPVADITSALVLEAGIIFHSVCTHTFGPKIYLQSDDCLTQK